MRRYLAEAAQHLGRLAGVGGEPEVQLRHLGAVHGAGVLDGECGGQRRRVKSQAAVFKRGVAEAVAEGKRRRDVVGIVHAKRSVSKNETKAQGANQR